MLWYKSAIFIHNAISILLLPIYVHSYGSYTFTASLMTLHVIPITSMMNLNSDLFLRHSNPSSSITSRSGSDARSSNNRRRVGVDMVQTEVTQFEYLDAEAIKLALQALASNYPDFVTLETAQDKYGLPAAGDENDCPFDSDMNGCKNYIITIEDKQGLVDNSTVAEVFLSGAVHGNERIGPTTVVEIARLLVQAAACEALPRQGFTGEERDEQIREAEECRAMLIARGIHPWTRRWLARLVATRRIVIIPTANALGYFQNKREEQGIDPNRDFPFDQVDWRNCMRTIAGRTINEIYREHIFQHSLTFHGGMVAIAYEWGAPSRNNPRGIPSPDDTAQIQLGLGLSNYAGSFSRAKGGYKYPHDSMNDLVYPVHGGMEDWAYGGSWDLELTKPCVPSTFGGYNVSKTTYNNATLRAFNFLVETSDNKQPELDTLGSDKDLFAEVAGDGNGHISRNIRLATMMIDTVEPYIAILGAGGLILPDDIVPMQKDRLNDCLTTHAISIPSNIKSIDIFWTIGGSFNVDETRVAYGKWDDDFRNMDCSTQPNTISDLFTPTTRITEAQTGKTRWNESGIEPNISFYPELIGTSLPFGSIFQETVDLSYFKDGDKVAVVPYASVDQHWKEQPKSFTPNVKPQSHSVNVRTDPSWRHESSGKVVQGRLHWRSTPLLIEISDIIEEPSFFESDRVHDDHHPSPTSEANYASDKNSSTRSTITWVFSIVPLTIAIIGIIFYRRKRRGNTDKKFELVATSAALDDDVHIPSANDGENEDIEG